MTGSASALYKYDINCGGVNRPLTFYTSNGPPHAARGAPPFGYKMEVPSFLPSINNLLV